MMRFPPTKRRFWRRTQENPNETLVVSSFVLIIPSGNYSRVLRYNKTFIYLLWLQEYPFSTSLFPIEWIPSFRIHTMINISLIPFAEQIQSICKSFHLRAKMFTNCPPLTQWTQITPPPPLIISVRNDMARHWSESERRITKGRAR